MQRYYQAEAEGGCGVVGFASTTLIKGKHLFTPAFQMHNRGNGKGGGIAAVGLSHEDLGVPKTVLEEDYLLQIALLDPSARPELEAEFITPSLVVDHAELIPTVADFHEVDGLETRPPAVWRYFVRVKDEVLDTFVLEENLVGWDRRRAEDEFIYRTTFAINRKFYASLGEKRAFVLSHGRNMLILKIVGYAESIITYYRLEDFRAHIWIAHQRYPTRGRVWHPGGAHPFIGMHEALVHNGDFANYHSVVEYLLQHNREPLFLTDTEVAVLLFDLLNREYHYPLEYLIEAMAPTTELDFERLPAGKQAVYAALQTAHIHGSPDGPWFFIIARNEPYERYLQLVGITDTSMLRPQVFALVESDELQLGLIASEKQAIDATLQSLAAEDSRFPLLADHYWNARGGSYTDGGAFIFTLTGDAQKQLTCTNKFSEPVQIPADQHQCDPTGPLSVPPESAQWRSQLELAVKSPGALFAFMKGGITAWDCNQLRWTLQELTRCATADDGTKTRVIEGLTLLLDHRYDTGTKKQSSVLQLIREALYRIFEATTPLEARSTGIYHRVHRANTGSLRPPAREDAILLLNVTGLPAEGEGSVARMIVTAYRLGWKRFMVYHAQGQRFFGSGLGTHSEGVRIDVYGSPGDYLGSSMDGAELYIHADGQDQLGQILKSGKLVVAGDVGQTFMYGAKGGEAYVLGNAAGRPLINAVGKPRVVINGICLDYLAESFMAGDPHKGGGFVVLNGLRADEHGRFRAQETPYPGSNLFSLASGGAIFIRDPQHQLREEQLNGGEFASVTAADWALIVPYLKENERLFGISVEDDLLRVNGVKRPPEEVYRKVQPIASRTLGLNGL